MEKMIENGQMSVATSANEKVVKYVNNNHCKGTKATYKVESHKYASDNHSAHSVWVDYYYNINQLKNCFHHNDYMDAEKFYVKDGRNWVEFNYDYEAEEKAILEKAEKIENIVEKLKAKKAEAITEAVPAEEKNYYFDCATNFYERCIVYNVLNAENLYNWFKKSKNKLTIAIKEAEGFIGVIYKADDGWWIKMLNSLAAGDLIEERYYIGKRITKNSFNDIVMWINAYVSDIWATPTEDNAEAEKVDNEVITEAEDFYFKTDEYCGSVAASNNNDNNSVKYHFDCGTNSSERWVVYNDLTAENLYNWYKASKGKFPITIKEIKGLFGEFYKGHNGDWYMKIVRMANYTETSVLKTYIGKRLVKNRFKEIVYYIEMAIDDINNAVQTEEAPAEDFYFKTEEYKKAEAEAVKALPF